MQNKQTLNKYKKYLEGSSLFPMQAFSNSILVLLYTTLLGLSMKEYLFLDMLLCSLNIVIEIPSGYISDKIGRKKAILISRAFLLMAYLGLLVGHDIHYGIGVVILVSIGTSLESGNIDAILYEKFVSLNMLDMLMKLYGKVNSKSMFLSIIYSLIAGVLIKFLGLKIIVIGDIALLFINSFYIYKYIESDKNGHLKENINKAKKTSILEDFKLIKNELKNCYLIFLILSLIFAYFRSSYNFYQPLILKQLDISKIPLIMSGLMLVSAGASKIYSKYLVNYFKDTKKGILIFVGSFIFLIVLLFINVNIFFYLIVSQLIRAVYLNLMNLYANKYISKNSEFRTSLISVLNFMLSGSISINLFFLSRFKNIDEREILIKYTEGFLGILVILTLSFLYLKAKNKVLEFT